MKNIRFVIFAICLLLFSVSLTLTFKSAQQARSDERMVVVKADPPPITYISAFSCYDEKCSKPGKWYVLPVEKVVSDWKSDDVYTTMFSATLTLKDALPEQKIWFSRTKIFIVESDEIPADAKHQQHNSYERDDVGPIYLVNADTLTITWTRTATYLHRNVDDASEPKDRTLLAVSMGLK